MLLEEQRFGFRRRRLSMSAHCNTHGRNNRGAWFIPGVGGEILVGNNRKILRTHNDVQINCTRITPGESGGVF